MTKQHIFQSDSWINVYGFHMSDTNICLGKYQKSSKSDRREVSGSEKLVQEVVMISDETSFSVSKL